MRSTDGGRSWRAERSLPAPSRASFQLVDCPSTGLCWFGEPGAPCLVRLSLGAGRGHWAETCPRVAYPHEGWNSVSCPSAVYCFAVLGAGYVSYVTPDGGKSWEAVAMPSAPRWASVTCATPAHCIAYGDGPAVLTTSDGGLSWSSHGL